MALFPVITQSLSVSSGFQLERAERAFTIVVPSVSPAVQVFVDFSAAPLSSANSFDFYRYQRSDWGGAAAPPGPYTAYSGSGPAIVSPITPPTPWARIAVSSALNQTASFQVLTIYAPSP